MKEREKFDKNEFLRMTSVSCVTEPQQNALTFMRNDDLRSFTDLINNPDVEAGASLVDHWINQPVDEAGATLLETAINLGRRKFIEHLLRLGVRVDIVSQASGYAPPHLAVEKGDLDLLRLFLHDRDNSDVNIKAADFKKGLAPLHIAAEKGLLDCMQLLLDFEEVDVDAKDIKGDLTPLLLAIKARNEEACKLLIENGACLDLKAGRQTLRGFLSQTFPHLDPSTIHVKKSRKVMLDLKDKVFKLLKETEITDNDYESKLANFKTYMRFIRNLKEQNSLDDVFDLACDKGLHEHVEVMLRKGASPNIPSKPVLEAAFYGHHKVLKVLKNYNTNFDVLSGTKETVLHLVLKMQSDFGTAKNYEKSLDVLLDDSNTHVFGQIKALVNKKDDRSNTALHYATQKWSQATVRKLLEIGANIGIKNFWEEIPISKIRPETMENFLSEFCLTSSGDVMHENFSMTFKYDFLAPNVDALPEKYRLEEKDQEDQEKLIKSQEPAPRHALPETEPLWYMSQSKEHRHLLKHPVITSFLWYKWQRIRRYFNRNLRFYTLFVYLLTWYIFKHYGGESYVDLVWYLSLIVLSVSMLFFIIKDWTFDIKNYQRNQMIENVSTPKESSCLLLTNVLFSNWVEAVFIVLLVVLIIFGTSCLKIVLAGLLVVFLLREILQMIVSMKRYVSSFENWMEIGIIVLVTFILCNENAENDELNRHFAAIVIVLSWAEMIILIGRHPKLKEYNIYVTMFFKVLKTFLLFFTWYCLFIIAFGLGLFILLHKSGTVVEDGEYVFFNKAWLSLVKTTTMFVGELEFSDIPINLDSKLAPLAYLFFLSFVFLIVVVLMNLLNGLAVSDTGLIREKAEIFSYRSQVETISTFESMLLGDPFDFLSNVPAMLSNLPSCSLLRQMYRNKTLRNMFTKIGASEILLFYKFLPNKCVTIHPNQRVQECWCLRVDDIGRTIVSAAKEIVIKQQTKQNKEDDDVSDKIEILQNRFDTKIAELENKMGNLETKIDLILRKMTKY